MDKAFRVYVSTPVDENLSPVQQQFKKAILAELDKAGIRRVGFHEPDEVSKFSVEGARELIRLCQGVLVLSFSQATSAHLVRQGESYIAPTEYNHLEGGMAVAQSKPLFVIRNSEVAFRGINSAGGHGYQVSIPQTAKPKAWVKTPTFRKAFDSWMKDVKKHRHVFLGYSGAAQSTANAINLYIKDLSLDVLDWRKFTAGESILQRIEEAARMCYCGIFIFTKDDALAAEDKKTSGKKAAGKKIPAAKAVAAPRDNVVFEAGYFVNARGKKRTLIVLEEGAKFPVDLGGDIYLPLKDRNDTSTIETGLNNYLNSVFASG